MAETRLKSQQAFGGDGWQPANESWVYASASTITVPSGAAAKYSKGDRIKWTQTTVKYGVVVAVADTLLTIAVNTDYTVANAAISANYYSHEISPVGYPGSFAVAAPTFTSTGTAFANQPQNNNWRVSINGVMCTVSGLASTHATSNATGLFIATFAGFPSLVQYGFGSCMNISNEAISGYAWTQVTGVFRFAKWDATQLAGNSAYFGFNASYMF